MLIDMLDNFIKRFQLILPIATGTAQHVNTDSAKKSAAVLLPIICKPEPTLLFTKRTDNLRLLMLIRFLFLVALANPMIII